MVDTGELVDKAVAERAGIGWSAKNTLIITPEFGSYVYLGEMITNIPFEADEPIEDGCGDCTLCIDLCPTGDRKSTRLNSSHVAISYAVFCLKKKRKKDRCDSVSCR